MQDDVRIPHHERLSFHGNATLGLVFLSIQFRKGNHEQALPTSIVAGRGETVDILIVVPKAFELNSNWSSKKSISEKAPVLSYRTAEADS